MIDPLLAPFHDLCAPCWAFPAWTALPAFFIKISLVFNNFRPLLPRRVSVKPQGASQGKSCLLHLLLNPHMWTAVLSLFNPDGVSAFLSSGL